MFFIIITDPWEHDPDSVIGPFNSEEEARKAWDELVKLGAHPDSFGRIVPLTDVNEARKSPPYTAFTDTHEEWKTYVSGEGEPCPECGRKYAEGHAVDCDYNDGDL